MASTSSACSAWGVAGGGLATVFSAVTLLAGTRVVLCRQASWSAANNDKARIDMVHRRRFGGHVNAANRRTCYGAGRDGGRDERKVRGGGRTKAPDSRVEASAH